MVTVDVFSVFGTGSVGLIGNHCLFDAIDCLLLLIGTSQFDDSKSRLRWFGHVERKDDNDWVKCCIMWEVEGIR